MEGPAHYFVDQWDVGLVFVSIKAAEKPNGCVNFISCNSPLKFFAGQ